MTKFEKQLFEPGLLPISPPLILHDDRLKVCLDGRLIQGDKGRKVHPKRCRLIRTRTSGPAEQPVGSTPRNTGCQGRARGGARDPTGRKGGVKFEEATKEPMQRPTRLLPGEGRADWEAIDPWPCPICRGIG